MYISLVIDNKNVICFYTVKYDEFKIYVEYIFKRK